MRVTESPRPKGAYFVREERVKRLRALGGDEHHKSISIFIFTVIIKNLVKDGVMLL